MENLDYDDVMEGIDNDYERMLEGIMQKFMEPEINSKNLFDSDGDLNFNEIAE